MTKDEGKMEGRRKRRERGKRRGELGEGGGTWSVRTFRLPHSAIFQALSSLLSGSLGHLFELK